LYIRIGCLYWFLFSDYGHVSLVSRAVIYQLQYKDGSVRAFIVPARGASFVFWYCYASSSFWLSRFFFSIVMSLMCQLFFNLRALLLVGLHIGGYSYCFLNLSIYSKHLHILIGFSKTPIWKAESQKGSLIILGRRVNQGSKVNDGSKCGSLCCTRRECAYTLKKLEPQMSWTLNGCITQTPYNLY